MKAIITICALLLWQSAAGAGIDYITSTSKPTEDSVHFSPRLLYSHIDGNEIEGNAVDKARSLIHLLGLYDLEGELLQAKIFPPGLLFEMGTVLQAIRVMDAWNSKKDKDMIKEIDEFDLAHTNLHFFKNTFDVRTTV